MWIRSEEGNLINMDHIVSVVIENRCGRWDILACPPDPDPHDKDQAGPDYFLIASFETEADADGTLVKLWDMIKPMNVFDMLGH